MGCSHSGNISERTDIDTIVSVDTIRITRLWLDDNYNEKDTNTLSQYKTLRHTISYVVDGDTVYRKVRFNGRYSAHDDFLEDSKSEFERYDLGNFREKGSSVRGEDIVTLVYDHDCWETYHVQRYNYDKYMIGASHGDEQDYFCTLRGTFDNRDGHTTYLTADTLFLPGAKPFID